MKRDLVFCIALSLCFIALDVKPEKPPLAKKVDHIFITSGQAQEPADPLLGTGQGVDHVGMMSRDLEKTITDYEQVLGFKCFRPDAGNNVFVFENTSYLELLPVAWSSFAADFLFHAKGHADFAEKHDGPMFLALATSSAKDAADYLKARNFEAALDAEEDAAYIVTISHEPSGSLHAFPLTIFLVEYVSKERISRLDDRREKGIMAHPNTARRLHSVWFAVRDLEASLKNIQDAGFEPGETCEAKFLEAKGREVNAGKGSMLLLQSIDQKGILNTFLQDHEDGSIIGLSIEVYDVEKARSLIESRSGQKLEPYDGFYGRSILISPDMTHGVWMEFFQR